LFGIYGAAAAVTLLAVAAFYVSFVAELPPPPPRLPKPKSKRKWRLRRKRGTDDVPPTSGDIMQHEATEGGTEADAETTEEPVPAGEVPASEEALAEVAEEPTTSHDTDADGALGTGAKPNTVYLRSDDWVTVDPRRVAVVRAFELVVRHFAFDHTGIGAGTAPWEQLVQNFSGDADFGVAKDVRGKNPGGWRWFGERPGGIG
jgi:hypothetical protein